MSIDTDILRKRVDMRRTCKWYLEGNELSREDLLNYYDNKDDLNLLYRDQILKYKSNLGRRFFNKSLSAREMVDGLMDENRYEYL